MKSKTTTLGKYAFPALAAAVLSLGATGASADGAEVLTLDIKPQQAGSALMELAGSSGVQILVSDEAGADVEVDGLTGEYKFDEALAALLTDTSLAYEYTSENVVLVQQAQPQESGQLEEVEAPDDTASVEEEEPLELATQTVTGTRLLGGDPSAQIYSFTAEDIARRGVSNLEEFFRKMPWAFPSITTQTYNEGGGNEVNRGTGPDFDSQIFGKGLGVSTVNLRGLGSPNTLVLMDGRRIAGTGGQEADFVNLLNVPLSAIERVEIQLGGASAVYGSDAIGGVVNFITKKDYRGLSASYRHEFSSTDADSTRASINGGYAWNSGNASLVLSRTTSEPITNAKTGFESRDMRSIFGPESAFDNRYVRIGQPGVACELVTIPWSPPPWNPAANPRPPTYRCPSFSGPYYQLPPGHSGEGATVDDFETFNVSFFPVYTAAPYPYDYVAPQNGVDATTTAAILNLEQYITENLRVFAGVNWSLNETYQQADTEQLNQIIVPASNAWNPFGKHMLVNYVPAYESANGLLPAPYDEAENERRSFNIGFMWNFDAFGASQELQVDISRTKSWRESSAFRPRATRAPFDPTAEAFYAAMSSSDPSRAINLFGNGTAQGSGFEEFLARDEGPFFGANETRQYNISMRGQLFNMWGGPVAYSVGGEYRENIIYSEARSSFDWEAIDHPSADPFIYGSILNTGVSRPSRDTQSWYAELLLPFVSPDNALPGVNSLLLTLQARRDTHESQGSLGGREDVWIPIRWHYWDPDEGFAFVESAWPERQINPNLTDTEFGRISPRVGIQYKPIADFALRGSWQRNFRSPTWQNYFGTEEPRVGRSSCGPFFGPGAPCIDPFDPDGPTEIPRGAIEQITLRYSPDIREEYSDNYSVSFDWFPGAIPGLRWSAQWEKTDFTDKIEASSGYLYDAETFPLAVGDPQIGVRNERGDLVAVNIREFNIAESLNELFSTAIEYSFDTRFGSFTPRVLYTRYLDDLTRLAPDSPTLTKLGHQKGNDVYKWEGSLTWSWNRFTADVFVYYSPGYTQGDDNGPFCQRSDVGLPGSRCTGQNRYLEWYVPSLTTTDLTLTYTLDNGLRILAGGRNIFDRAAPAAWFWGQPPYDPTRWDARGQVLFVEVNWEM